MPSSGEGIVRDNAFAIKSKCGDPSGVLDNRRARLCDGDFFILFKVPTAWLNSLDKVSYSCWRYCAKDILVFYHVEFDESGVRFYACAEKLMSDTVILLQQVIPSLDTPTTHFYGNVSRRLRKYSKFH